MEALIPLLIIVVVVAIAIWIIRLIPFPAELEIVRTVLYIIIAILALVKVLGYL